MLYIWTYFISSKKPHYLTCPVILWNITRICDKYKNPNTNGKLKLIAIYRKLQQWRHTTLLLSAHISRASYQLPVTWILTRTALPLAAFLSFVRAEATAIVPLLYSLYKCRMHLMARNIWITLMSAVWTRIPDPDSLDMRRNNWDGMARSLMPLAYYTLHAHFCCSNDGIPASGFFHCSRNL